MVSGLSYYIRIEETQFTHLRRRILKIKRSVKNLDLYDDDGERPVTLIVDASGLTTTKKGHYIEQKWIRKRKEFVKLHIAVEGKTKKIISFRVTIFMTPRS